MHGWPIRAVFWYKTTLPARWLSAKRHLPEKKCVSDHIWLGKKDNNECQHEDASVSGLRNPHGNNFPFIWQLHRIGLQVLQSLMGSFLICSWQNFRGFLNKQYRGVSGKKILGEQEITHTNQPVKYGPAALLLSCARVWKFPPRIPLLCSSSTGKKKRKEKTTISCLCPAEEEKSRGILGGNFQTGVHDGNKAAGPYLTGWH